MHYKRFKKYSLFKENWVKNFLKPELYKPKDKGFIVDKLNFMRDLKSLYIKLLKRI